MEIKMKTKLVLTIFLVIVLVSGFGWATGVVFADAPCDSTYVAQSGDVITVQPSGVNDTENIQCAFDAAVAAGPGVDVRLGEGTYYTAQIVVNDFYGNFYGAGSKYTTLTNLPNLYVTPVDFYFNPPSAANPWPSLYVFVEGDFVLSDLAIHISGDHGTTGWTIFGIDPPITELAHGIAILGPYADAKFEHLLVEGEPADNSLLGYNLINGIFYEGFIGEAPPPISGLFQVIDSTFSHLGSGTPIANLYQARVVVSKNTFNDVFLGMDGGDLVNSSLEYSYNAVNAFIGLDLYNMDLVEDTGSTIIIKNNRFQGVIGPALEQAFGNDNYCLLQGNNVQNVTDIGILLGPEISGCTVVGGNNKTNVLDLGTGNVLVGVNNMGTGVGPEIQTLLKIMK
jgi:hypothetical protein